MASKSQHWPTEKGGRKCLNRHRKRRLHFLDCTDEMRGLFDGLSDPSSKQPNCLNRLCCTLLRCPFTVYLGEMTASEVIEQIKALPPDEQERVMEFVRQLPEYQALNRGQIRYADPEA